MPCVDPQHRVAGFHDQFTVDLKNAQAGLNTLETGIFKNSFLERNCISVWKGLNCVGSLFQKVEEKGFQTRQPGLFLIKLQVIADDKCSGNVYQGVDCMNLVKVLIVQHGNEQVAKCVFSYKN